MRGALRNLVEVLGDDSGFLGAEVLSVMGRRAIAVYAKPGSLTREEVQAVANALDVPAALVETDHLPRDFHGITENVGPIAGWLTPPVPAPSSVRGHEAAAAVYHAAISELASQGIAPGRFDARTPSDSESGEYEIHAPAPLIGKILSAVKHAARFRGLGLVEILERNPERGVVGGWHVIIRGSEYRRVPLGPTIQPWRPFPYVLPMPIFYGGWRPRRFGGRWPRRFGGFRRRRP